MLRTFTLCGVLLSTLAVAAEDAPISAPPLVGVDAAAPSSLGSGRFRYSGRTVPAGFHLVSEPKWGLVAGGAALMGISTGVMVALAIGFADPVYAVPLVGPVYTFSEIARTSSGWFSGFAVFFGGVLMAADLAAQIAGGVMFTLGLAKPSRWLERDAPSKPTVTFVPGAAGAPMGASLVGRF